MSSCASFRAKINASPILDMFQESVVKRDNPTAMNIYTIGLCVNFAGKLCWNYETSYNSADKD